MKTLKKIIPLVLCIGILSSLNAGAIAPDADPNFSSGDDINRKFYTPVTVAQTRIYFTNLSWANSSYGDGKYWEGEIRGALGDSVHDAYTDVIGFTTDLPNGYLDGKKDPDDISIGVSEMNDLTRNEKYYATVSTERADTLNDGINLLFESEYGDWIELIHDGDPLRYQIFDTYLNTVDNTIIYWR